MTRRRFRVRRDVIRSDRTVVAQPECFVALLATEACLVIPVRVECVH
jgi:hypothetical protein